MKLNEALLEKEQVSNDLNTMERSFADLFKRLEKYKDVVQGYKKVGKHKHFIHFITHCYKTRDMSCVLAKAVAVLVKFSVPFP